jgi:hypothetical protein
MASDLFFACIQILIYRYVRTNFCGEVLPRFFKSAWGLGRRPMIRHFSFDSFSLCASHKQREKRARSLHSLNGCSHGAFQLS